MRCFVSGYTGFIGQNLLPYLHVRNIRCCGYSRNPNATPPAFMEYACNSLPEDLNGFDAVIHLAGKAHDTKNTAKMDEYIKANVDFTQKLYDIFLRSDARKFIYLSSIKAVADQSMIPLDESCAAAPQSIYGQTKLMAENYILNNLPMSGKEVYILRPCMVHGPGNKGNLNTLYRAIGKGIPIPFGAIKNDRSFLSVENLNFIIHELIKNHVSGGIYHLSDNGTISTANLIRLIAQTTDIHPRILSLPPYIINFFAKLGDLLHLPINTRVIDKLTGSFIVDNSKIINAIQKELPIGLVEGLKKTIQSFKF